MYTHIIRRSFGRPLRRKGIATMASHDEASADQVRESGDEEAAVADDRVGPPKGKFMSQHECQNPGNHRWGYSQDRIVDT
mmetsp:Transcript_116113/g.369455  ORF Transcript_116113/g.369455 Transcript_116113/m.369455 type:complete len:80 (-) Transcript_116113:442-681(-)